MIKKIISVVIAAALLPFTTLLPFKAFAAEEVIDESTADKSRSINVVKNVDVSYTVTIPADITFTDSEKQVESSILASDVVLNDGDKLNISVSSQNNFRMVNKSGYIDYTMKVNEKDISDQNDVTILSVEAGSRTGWAILVFDTDLSGEHTDYAGNYSDTLTFTINVGK